ncbi:glycerol-3-phosphate dehydrogenase/oxidase [Maribellus sp. YY47]|uniref:glycerol-3-phosphate dehydrogenase/oxidase n=1 Tax=Maribellus sp. YY47 TaxID=2929486 RepID=UPI00200105DB|nr:glycerol-3-phosphate dehydrogenase/oxidase [Maribellus sp. YY47]MCK3684734.1 glycerol-3-phosphate dehydrogenase/oxidase [Maribellus sp. YY47]
MKRNKLLEELSSQKDYDIVIIGGGATGLGVAVDAASRGYRTILIEQHDFSKGTSSRSTKLVHGGVRYLAQGDVRLVVEALRERGRMRRNAPHLVKDMRFIIGNYKWWERSFYTIGLTCYDVLAGKMGLGRSLPMTSKSVIKEIPGLKKEKLKGGVVYHDGQFDDSRLAISLVQTAFDNGGTCINYMKATGLIKNAKGKVAGVDAVDALTGTEYRINAKSVINATGVFVDELMGLDAPEGEKKVRPSQGVHLVVNKEFLGGKSAIMIPKTDDGRVLFGVPWHDKVVLGTTDTPLNHAELEPRALEEEVDFILDQAGKYLAKQPKRSDVLSVFAGLRPLAAPTKNDGQKTKEISRSHKLYKSKSGLITITGGKWTTYREMAEEVVNEAIKTNGLPAKECVTADMRIHGYAKDVDESKWDYVYGSDIEKINKLIKKEGKYDALLHPDYTFKEAHVVWAVREEMAQTVEDVLARRVRALFIDARAAIEMAPRVAAILAEELNKTEEWKEQQIQEFNEIAKGYFVS